MQEQAWSADADSGGIVFVVDNEELVVRALHRLLASAGYRSEVFTSADDLLGRIPVDRSCCVILDVHLGQGFGGLDLQAKLSVAAPGIPVICMSGISENGERVLAMDAGALNFLRKPINDEVLLACVRNALAISRQTRKSRPRT